MRVAGSYKGPGNTGLKTLNNGGYIGLTFAKGTFGLQEGCSDDEGFNVSHKCNGDWIQARGLEDTSTAGCAVLFAKSRLAWWSHGNFLGSAT